MSTLQCLSSGSTQAGAAEGRQVCKQIINRQRGKGAGKRADEQRRGSEKLSLRDAEQRKRCLQ